MELFKKLMTYTIILLGLAFVATLVSASYLYLVKDSEIFGYYYVSGTALEYTDTYYSNLTTYEAIEVETYGFDVEIYPQTDNLNEIQITYTNNALGFTKSGEKEFDYNVTYDESTNTIRFATVEPTSGLILYSNAQLTLGLPEISS